MEIIQNKVQTFLDLLQEEQKVRGRTTGANTNVCVIFDSVLDLYLLQEREKQELKTEIDLLLDEIAQHVAVQEIKLYSIFLCPFSLNNLYIKLLSRRFKCSKVSCGGDKKPPLSDELNCSPEKCIKNPKNEIKII